MKKNLILVVKGFIIGIAKIIPGVSGALLAISMNIYDKGIDAICNFFKNKKENFRLLFCLGIGVVLALIVFSKVIMHCLNNYYFITMFFFLGLVIGGMLPVFKEIKIKSSNIIIGIIAFVIIFLLTFSNIDNDYVFQNNFIDYIVLFFTGILDAIGTVIPGVSSTALLMIMGLYDVIIEALSNITNIQFVITNLEILIPFTLGMLLGLIVVAMIMNYLFKKHKEKTYALIIGISLASVLLLCIKSFGEPVTIINFIIGLIMLGLGIFIATKLDR